MFKDKMSDGTVRLTGGKSAGGGGGGSLDWVDIENKPSSFTPSSHTHTKSDVDGLNTDLNTLTTALGGLKFVVTDDYSSIISPDPWTVYIEVAELPEV